MQWVGLPQQIKSNNQLGLLMIGGDMSGAINYFTGLSLDNKDDNNDHDNLDFWHNNQPFD